MKKLIALSLVASAIALTGCQTTNGYNQVINDTKKQDAVNDAPMITKLEGSTHKIWKEASTLSLRNELVEGETITFKDVEAKHYSTDTLYLGHIYSSDGQMLFEDKYTLRDVGVYDFSEHLNKSIDKSKTAKTRGIAYHGDDVFIDSTFSQPRWKTSGGATPKATPIRDYKSFSGDVKKDEEYKSGLYMTCINKNIYLSFHDQYNTYAANGEDITVSVYYPYSKAKHYETTSLGYNGAGVKVDNYIERILLNEDAIKLSAFSHANKGMIWKTAYNNGMAEAYTRLKTLCH
ncbi:hypothetical protein [Vibrio mediterranei]|jgi:predicted small secreted protein|uniref:hypothetical protein n=1 Tax=Vibrio mediterranei TaxID=689 RepID=UPI0022852C9C|nr:hypothetical protein [Vibrio mediterranei]MCY9855301.1 hypothetical protein [Vibrio mediterranei]